MSYQINNYEIGPYISELIDRKFGSTREFCRQYLQESGDELTETKIQNLANRLSQIKKGIKAIQLYDLPLFSVLLGVTSEQILSAGKCGEPKRMTNYTIAQSHSRAEWTDYIKKTHKPILNPDEYGNTVLDYAIRFGNYEFIKFLIKENYIWFDSKNDSDYVMTFGAGTNIQRIKFEERGNGVFIRQPDMDDLHKDDSIIIYDITPGETYRLILSEYN